MAAASKKKTRVTTDPYITVMIIVRSSKRHRWMEQARQGGKTVPDWAEVVLDRACDENAPD